MARRKAVIVSWISAIAVLYIISINILSMELQRYTTNKNGDRKRVLHHEHGGAFEDQSGIGGQKSGSELRLAGPRTPWVCRNLSGTGVEAEVLYSEAVKEVVFVYSAFYDTRLKPATIRMLAMVKRKKTPKLFCHFKHGGRFHNISSAVAYYEMCENHYLPYGGWILNCVVPAEVSPADICSVVVSQDIHVTKPALGITVHPMSIEREESASEDIAVDVCVPPIFGDPDPRKLVEFVELTKLLGAEKIVVYMYTENANVTRTLRYYESRGDVVIRPWKLPFNEIVDFMVTGGPRPIKAQSITIWYYGQSVAINDCLYRSMSGARLVIFNDLDEFLVPKGELTTWRDLLKTLDTTTMAAFTFKSAFFGRGNSRDHFSFAGNRSAFSGLRNKVMVQPDRIIEVGIHHVSKALPGYDVLAVPPDKAFIHHYNDCHREKGLACDDPGVSDETVEKNFASLHENVKQAEDALGL